jgi:ATP-dependent Clp protease ATP-binding subunit ClpC
MFQRFTDRARRVVVLAQDEARELNHSYIGTEHILLGLVHEGEGVAAKALLSLGIGLEIVRQEVEEVIGRGEHSPPGHIPFTPRAKKVLELSLRESLQLGHDYIGTEHILLGLLREGDGVAAQVLVRLGADMTRVRRQVIMLLEGRENVAVATPLRAGDVPEEVMLRRSIVRERWMGEVQKSLTKIGERLDAIERHLGLASGPAGQGDPEAAGGAEVPGGTGPDAVGEAAEGAEAAGGAEPAGGSGETAGPD